MLWTKLLNLNRFNFKIFLQYYIIAFFRSYLPSNFIPKCSVFSNHTTQINYVRVISIYLLKKCVCCGYILIMMIYEISVILHSVIYIIYVFSQHHSFFVCFLNGCFTHICQTLHFLNSILNFTIYQYIFSVFFFY